MSGTLDITTGQRKALLGLLRQFIPGVEVWAYGSRVKWNARPNSDLDLVAFTTPAERNRISELKEALEESDLPFPVDIHVWDEVPNRFHEIIRKEYVVVQEVRGQDGPLEKVGGWKTATVAELQRDGVLLVEDGNHGEYRPRPDEFVDSGVAFIRAADMDSGRVRFESASKINERARQRITKGIGAPGDVLLSHKGTVGKVALVSEDAPAFVCSPQTTFWRTLDMRRLDRKYLYAFLRSSGFHAQLATRAGETDMAPYVSLTSQRGLLVDLPPIDAQRAIGHILGTLDDKIELNRRMNETLEAMARALFKSWFVNFDPVRAKAEGRDPGLPQPLADLFPDSFEDSEMGEIPKGWGVSSIYEIADVIYGAPFASAQFNINGIGEPLIRIRDLADESPGVWTPEEHPKGYKVRAGDIVVGMDGEFRAYLWGGAEAWLNQRVCVFVPKGGYSAAFVRNSILEPLAHVEATETATTVIHLGKSDIDRFAAVVPTASILAAFNQCCQPWYDQIVGSKRESRPLAALRDTLLPKLISGELRVKDAEEFIGRELP